MFGSATGIDPRSLGENECSGYELGLSRPQVAALEQLALDQQAECDAVKPAQSKLAKASDSVRCLAPS